MDIWEWQIIGNPQASIQYKRTDVLPQNLVKSLSSKIGCYDDCVTLKLDRHLGSAAEMPV